MTEATFDTTVTALSTNVTPADIYGVIASYLPWVGTMVIVALGLYFLRKGVKGASKAKVKF